MLRWRDSDSGMPVVFSAAVAGTIDLFINGKEIARRAILPWGENTLALRLKEVDPRYPFIMSTQLDLPDRHTRPVIREGCTETGAGWKFHSEEQPEWHNGTFDDRTWTTFSETNDDFPQQHNWSFTAIQRTGAQALRLPSGCSTVFIRKKLTIVRGAL